MKEDDEAKADYATIVRRRRDITWEESSMRSLKNGFALRPFPDGRKRVVGV